jgi:hypothetical protein
VTRRSGFTVAGTIGVLVLASLLIGGSALPNTDARLTALEGRMTKLEARVSVLEGGSPAPTVAPSAIATPAPSLAPTPTASPSSTAGPSPTSSAAAGWSLVFDDEMDRPVALGHLLDASIDAYHTSDGRYTVYKSGWLDTSKVGHYDPAIASIANGIFDIAIKTAGGYPHVFAMTALPTGSSAKGGLLSMRCEVRIRADLMIGYKGVPMCGWADAATTNDLLLQYGENDFPEANFDQSPAAYMHWTNATAFGQQDWYPTGASWQTWHTYRTDWIGTPTGGSVEFSIDGRSIGKSTSRTPVSPMHANFQFETWTNGVVPDPAVTGHVQIDFIHIYSRAA